MILRLPQVILDVGVEVNGFGPAVAEDGLTDVLFVVGWHGTVAAVVFVVALTVEMVDEMLLQRMSNALGHVVVYLCDTEGHADGLVVAVHGACFGLHRRVIVPAFSANNCSRVLGVVSCFFIFG